MTGTATLRREKDQIAARARGAAAGAAPADMELDETTMEQDFDAYDKLAETDIDGAISSYEKEVTAGGADGAGAAAGVKRKEAAFVRAAKLFNKHKCTNAMKDLITAVRPFLSEISKAKGGKLFRVLLDNFLEIDNATVEQVAVTAECIEWTKAHKRRFLKQTLEIVLTKLHIKARQFQDALAVAQPLIRELKRLDDKMQLVEVQLMESIAYYALSNYPKSRGALVSARTTANAIYCPPKMQSALDLQSGIMAAQEQDFKTAFSYFFEAFEGFDSTSVANQAVLALKYMLLCKIMTGEADTVPTLLSGKLALKYSSGSMARSLEAMRVVASANLDRSLADFEKAFTDYKVELEDDIIIMSHVNRMYDNMLQNNLCRIVEPFSRVEIEHVAHLIKLDRAVVESKLSQMILDKKLPGILDQGTGTLEIFEVTDEDKAYAAALSTIEHTAEVVEALFTKAKKLS
mmetsp:Transcript_28291/g.74222  ORF Transcript_28291/g.74222 Transcript_28291/m.74222 type:complete len:461 (-) Transcript_28291:45-1427(-)